VDNDQYLCAANADGRQQCVSFPYQLKVLDTQNLPTTGNDKAVVDEISRLKGINLPTRIDVTAPVEGSTTVQQPTKSTFPIFRRTAPGVR